jgi:hypothetical protein
LAQYFSVDSQISAPIGEHGQANAWVAHGEEKQPSGLVMGMHKVYPERDVRMFPPGTADRQYGIRYPSQVDFAFERS